MKNSLPYIKCVLRLSCVVHRPIYGRFMGCTVNGSLSSTKVGDSSEAARQIHRRKTAAPTAPIASKLRLGNTR